MWITQVSILWFQRWGGEVSHKFISINSHNTTFSKLINHFRRAISPWLWTTPKQM